MLSLNPLLPGIPIYSIANCSHSIPVRALLYVCVYERDERNIFIRIIVISVFVLYYFKTETNKSGRNVSGIIVIINILEHTWKVNKYTEERREIKFYERSYIVFVNPSFYVNVMSFYIIQIIFGKSDVYMHLLILFTHI